MIPRSAWYSYVVGAEAVEVLEDRGVGEVGHGRLIIIDLGVAITDRIMDPIIAHGVTDLDPDGGDMVRIGEDLTGEVRIGEVIYTMSRIRPMALIPHTGTDTRIL